MQNYDTLEIEFSLLRDLNVSEKSIRLMNLKERTHNQPQVYRSHLNVKCIDDTLDSGVKILSAEFTLPLGFLSH